MHSNGSRPAWAEKDRLAALASYAILDTSPEQAFDDVVKLTGQLLGAPIVAVNLIAEGRQWFKAEIGLGVREMPLDDSICKVAILHQERMVVPDTRDDPRFACNPLVTGRPGLRFYAGELLVTPDGFPLGTLCVLDTEPRPQGLTEQQQFALKTLAQQVQAQLELRKVVHEQRQFLAEKESLLANLFESRERFHSIVRQAATGVVEADRDGRLTLVNRKYCDMLGYEESELIGLDVFDVTAPGSIQVTADALAKVAAGASGCVVEKQYVRKDGSLMWASSSVSSLCGAGGQSQSFMAIVVDISESKRSQDNLRKLATNLSEADRRKTEFLATLAHELRNPLAPIRTGLALLRMRGDTPEAVGKIREMLDRQVGQMVHLVDELLDIARISGGKVMLQKSAVTLKSLIENALETSMPIIDGGNHELVVALPDESVMLDADPVRIAQIFSNLLNNAAKYTPAGGRIEVRTEARTEGERREVMISFADNGVGIAPASLATIFDMFNQVGESLNRSQGGLGIGLSLVRRLVEMHGGSVTAASAGLGQGSVFTVRLPILGAEVVQMSSDAVQRREVATGGRRFRLLVADDNVDAAETLSIMLALNGHITEVAKDGLQAIKLVQNFKPEVAFLDIGMPGMNGYEAANRIRSTAGLESTILVALTGWGDVADRVRSREAGFDHHLIKPVDYATVEALLAKLPARPESAALE